MTAMRRLSKTVISTYLPSLSLLCFTCISPRKGYLTPEIATPCVNTTQAAMGDYFVYEFDRNLQSLLQVYGAESIKGIVFGRFEESCKLDQEVIKKVIKDKIASNIPVVFGVDFGHVFPMITYPIGGKVRIEVKGDEVDIRILNH